MSQLAHGRVDPANLSLRVRLAILDLKAAVAADHPRIRSVQVTLDQVAAADVPPTVDVIACIDPDGDEGALPWLMDRFV